MAEYVCEVSDRGTENERTKYRAVDENGNVLSKGRFIPARTAFGKGFLKSVLAAGIATPVEHRRGGLVRGMFSLVHERSAEEGVAVSLLHPFSFAYYDRLGYAKVGDHLIARVPVRLIDSAERRCDMVPYEPRMLQDVISVSDAFCRGRDLLVKRTGDKWFVNEDKGYKTYVGYSEGKPAAYIVYTTSSRFDVNRLTDTVLTVREFGYTGPAGLRMIVSFIRMFEGEFETAEFTNLAMAPEFDLMLRHCEQASWRKVPDIAARILNAAPVLEAGDYPEREGAFTLRITDGGPGTEGFWRVEYGGSDRRVRRTECTGEADITLTQRAFTRLAYGYDRATPEFLGYMDGVEAAGDPSGFLAAFGGRPGGVFEHF